MTSELSNSNPVQDKATLEYYDRGMNWSTLICYLSFLMTLSRLQKVNVDVRRLTL
jgi:hypothetical protein